MIPVSEPALGDREAELVADCVRSGWISSAGRYIGEFESKWAAYCGRSFGVSVANGTVALELAVRALDLEPGDEVIMPAFTIISCALAVVRNGGIPVLVDADPETWCMDVRQIEERITPRTRALMPVHIYGHPVDMAPLLDLAEPHGLKVIEDAAEAHGAAYRMPSGDWKRCGSFGAVSTFSFYANKIVTTGEGGMVLTDDEALARRMATLRNLAFQPGRRFFHDDLGYNFRITNIQAAIGLAQVERADEVVQRKREIAARYAAHLRDIPGVRLPVERPWARNVYWMNGLILEPSVPIDAAEMARRLLDAGVETRPFFLGMHRQPALLRRGLFAGESFPVTDVLAERGLYLPSGTGLSDADVDRVSEAVISALQ